MLYTTPGGDISVADFADVTSVELKNSTSVIVTTTRGQAVTLTSSDATLAGDSVTSLDLTLDKVGTASNQGAISLAGAGLTTLNITGANNASSLDINPGLNLSPLKTLNIAGDQNITASVRSNVTTIDASSASGNISIIANMPNISADLTFKGGSGDDKIVLFQSLTSGVTLMGGAGIDTLSISVDPISSASAVANISEFEIFEAAGVGTYDLSFLNVKNALIGLVISSPVNAATTISNINAASTSNIRITKDSITPVVLNASDFVAGGASDTATIILDNSVSKSDNGIDAQVTFPDLDVLNLISKSDGTPTRILRDVQIPVQPGEIIDEPNSLLLEAPDLDRIVITGDEALVVVSHSLPSEIDASGLDAAVVISPYFTQTSILSKGNTYDDIFYLPEITQATLFTGGGSDKVLVKGGSSSSAHNMIFTATELNAGDLKAGDMTEVTLLSPTAGATVTINLSAQLEGLLKSDGTLLSDTNANINILGTSLSDTTNIAASQIVVSPPSGKFNRFFHDAVRLQFDLNGDGIYSATDDAQISLIGTGSNRDNAGDTLVYNAAADTLIYTVV